MRYRLLVGLVGLMVVAVVQAADGKLPPHPVSKQGPAQISASHAQQGLAQQRLAQHQAEVKQLEQDVARQESDSRQASKRLQQQDQAIAELQRQLDALHAKPPAGQH